jgi:hypothetical protein
VRNKVVTEFIIGNKLEIGRLNLWSLFLKWFSKFLWWTLFYINFFLIIFALINLFSSRICLIVLLFIRSNEFLFMDAAHFAVDCQLHHLWEILGSLFNLFLRSFLGWSLNLYLRLIKVGLLIDKMWCFTSLLLNHYRFLLVRINVAHLLKVVEQFPHLISFLFSIVDWNDSLWI